MTPEENYEIILSNENIPIIIIKYKKGEPSKPLIFYTGQKHAILYRTPNEAILLDYINPKIHDIFKTAPFAIIMEKTPDNTDIAKDYKAFIHYVSQNKTK